MDSRNVPLNTAWDDIIAAPQKGSLHQFFRACSTRPMWSLKNGQRDIQAEGEGL
jgi:hypothetical protein